MKQVRTVFTAMLAALVLFAPLQARAQAATDKWSFSLMPYLWLPTVDAKLRYGPPPAGGASANVSADSGNYLDNLEFALMLAGTARKGRWVIGSDLMYMDFSGVESKVRSVDFNPGPGPINISTTDLNAGVNSSLKGLVWTLLGGYDVLQNKDANLAVLGGFRYLRLEASTSWTLTANVTGPAGTTPFASAGSASKTADLWSGIVGLGGRAKLGNSNWFVNYYADVGGGSSVFTWQGVVGAGYAFKWGDVILDYRYLYYDQSGDKLLQEIKFGGLALGANFRF